MGIDDIWKSIVTGIVFGNGDISWKVQRKAVN